MHLPFVKKGYLEFLKKTYHKYKCNHVVCLGDLFDFHRISFHDAEPDSDGAVQEYKKALKEAKKFYKAFPKVDLILGNHDLRVTRVGKKAMIPGRFFRTFEEISEVPKGWKIHMEDVVLDDVMYIHGEGFSGNSGHLKACIANMQSTVIGHLHSFAGIAFKANRNTLVFGMNVGCGIDVGSYAMEYGRKMKYKPIISCGAIINGKPYLETMDLGERIVRK